MSGFLQLSNLGLGDYLTGSQNYLLAVLDINCRGTSKNTQLNLIIIQQVLIQSLCCSTILFSNNHILCNINQTPGEVTCGSGFHGCVSVTLSGTGCVDEVFVRGQTQQVVSLHGHWCEVTG